MNKIKPKFEIRSRLRNVGATLFGAALGLAMAASAMAADTVTLRVGDQKGGNRSLLEIAGLAKDLPYKIEWSEFPAAAPVLEALNAGALGVGYTGDLAFLTVYAAGAPIKAIGGTRADARTQAILVRKDSPIKTAADLTGKRAARRLGPVPDRRDAGEGRIQDRRCHIRAAGSGGCQDCAGRGLDRWMGCLGALRVLCDAQGQRADCRRWGRPGPYN